MPGVGAQRALSRQGRRAFHLVGMVAHDDLVCPFARHHFPPGVIRCAVWLYVRFTLSYPDVEDMLAERGLDLSYERVRR